MNRTLLAVAALMTLALLPSQASATTCSDHSTKPKRSAADTRGADGDGVYCVIYSA